MKFPQSIKIILCGAGGAGKTSFVNRYLTNSFDPVQVMTLGITYATRDLAFASKHVELQIWDFGGQAEYRALLQNYAEGVSGILLMFDLTSFSTFLALDRWMDVLRNSSARSSPVILVGCKDDLCERDPREQALPDDTIREYVRAHHMLDFVRTSAASGKNVDACFDRLVKEALSQSVIQGGASLE